MQRVEFSSIKTEELTRGFGLWAGVAADPQERLPPIARSRMPVWKLCFLNCCHSERQGQEQRGLDRLLTERGVRSYSLDDWLVIEKAEAESAPANRIREKFTDLDAVQSLLDGLDFTGVLARCTPTVFLFSEYL